MNFWVRSQDKECLIKTNIVEMEYFGDECTVLINTRFDGKIVSLGRYETKERVLEILDEIQKLIDRGIKFLYIMPEE